MKILIVGQGIAGSLLTWYLHENQHEVTLVSNSEDHCASRVAAGVLTPITGKRFAVSWEYHRLHAAAVTTYENLGHRFNETFLYPRETIRVFRSAQEKALWDKKKKARLDFLPFIKNDLAPHQLPAPWNDPLGSMTLIHGGWCDSGKLLDRLDHFFINQKILLRQTLEPTSLTIKEESIIWNNQSFDVVIFCEGYHIRHNPFFKYLPFEHVKGEILTLGLDASIPDDSILNFGKWLVPYPDGSFRCGSTYDWYDLTETPTLSARNTILDTLRQHFPVTPEILGQQAGVRPVCKDMKPVLGPHPKYPRIWVFNGLGAKGILRAPYLAQHLVDVLERKTALWEEVNCRRFWNSTASRLLPNGSMS